MCLTTRQSVFFVRMVMADVKKNEEIKTIKNPLLGQNLLLEDISGLSFIVPAPSEKPKADNYGTNGSLEASQKSEEVSGTGGALGSQAFTDIPLDVSGNSEESNLQTSTTLQTSGAEEEATSSGGFGLRSILPSFVPRLVPQALLGSSSTEQPQVPVASQQSHLPRSRTSPETVVPQLLPAPSNEDLSRHPMRPEAPSTGHPTPTPPPSLPPPPSSNISRTGITNPYSLRRPPTNAAPQNAPTPVASYFMPSSSEPQVASTPPSQDALTSHTSGDSQSSLGFSGTPALHSVNPEKTSSPYLRGYSESPSAQMTSTHAFDQHPQSYSPSTPFMPSTSTANTAEKPASSGNSVSSSPIVPPSTATSPPSSVLPPLTSIMNKSTNINPYSLKKSSASPRPPSQPSQFMPMIFSPPIPSGASPENLLPDSAENSFVPQLSANGPPPLHQRIDGNSPGSSLANQNVASSTSLTPQVYNSMDSNIPPPHVFSSSATESASFTSSSPSDLLLSPAVSNIMPDSSNSQEKTSDSVTVINTPPFYSSSFQHPPSSQSLNTERGLNIAEANTSSGTRIESNDYKSVVTTNPSSSSSGASTVASISAPPLSSALPPPVSTLNKDVNLNPYSRKKSDLSNPYGRLPVVSQTNTGSLPFFSGSNQNSSYSGPMFQSYDANQQVANQDATNGNVKNIPPAQVPWSTFKSGNGSLMGSYFPSGNTVSVSAITTVLTSPSAGPSISTQSPLHPPSETVGNTQRSGSVIENQQPSINEKPQEAPIHAYNDTKQDSDSSLNNNSPFDNNIRNLNSNNVPNTVNLINTQEKTSVDSSLNLEKGLDGNESYTSINNSSVPVIQPIPTFNYFSASTGSCLPPALDQSKVTSELPSASFFKPINAPDVSNMSQHPPGSSESSKNSKTSRFGLSDHDHRGLSQSKRVAELSSSTFFQPIDAPPVTTFAQPSSGTLETSTGQHYPRYIDHPGQNNPVPEVPPSIFKPIESHDVPTSTHHSPPDLATHEILPTQHFSPSKSVPEMPSSFFTPTYVPTSSQYPPTTQPQVVYPTPIQPGFFQSQIPSGSSGTNFTSNPEHFFSSSFNPPSDLSQGKTQPGPTSSFFKPIDTLDVPTLNQHPSGSSEQQETSPQDFSQNFDQSRISEQEQIPEPIYSSSKPTDVPKMPIYSLNSQPSSNFSFPPPCTFPAKVSTSPKSSSEIDQPQEEKSGGERKDLEQVPLEGGAVPLYTSDYLSKGKSTDQGPTSTDPGSSNSYRLGGGRLRRPSYPPISQLGLTQHPRDTLPGGLLEGGGGLQELGGREVESPEEDKRPSTEQEAKDDKMSALERHNSRVSSGKTSPSNSATLETYYANLAPKYRPPYHHWFFKSGRSKKSPWTPFSMADSMNLEQIYSSSELLEDTKVPTDGGRYDVEIIRRRKTSVYWAEPAGEVRRCSWFVKSTTDSKFTPYDENLAALLEDEYRGGCETNEWNRRVELADGEVIILHSPTAMAHHVRSASPDGWSAQQGLPTKPLAVKRGVEDFSIPKGEPNQVDHLLLMVHGVGKACDLRFRSLVEVVDDFRIIAQQLVGSHFHSGVENGNVGRVEILPVEWHGALHTEQINDRLTSITLPSIPRAREFTNETLLDILFYTSPVFAETIVQAVGEELNRVYSLYKMRNPGFRGQVSLGGHSLGSLILFDILCHQQPRRPVLSSQTSLQSGGEEDEAVDELGCLSKGKVRLSRRMSYLTIGPGTGQPYSTYPQLQFKPRSFFALGSPIGMFVTVRGLEALGEDFKFPTCPAFFNIFHPNDPVAYRIEPLIKPELASVLAVLIPHHKGRKRMHLELKETMAHVTAALKQKLVDSMKNTWNALYRLSFLSRPDHSLEGAVHQAIEEEGLRDEEGSIYLDDDPPISLSTGEEGAGSDVRVGRLNGGRRIDYVLQEAPLETFNQYISAIRSHLVYWESEDTTLMILKEIYGSMGISPDSQVPQTILPFDLTPSDTYSEYTYSVGATPSQFIRK